MDTPSFERALENDIAALAAEIKRNREHPELRNAGEKEIVKEAIRAFPRLERSPANGSVASGSAAVAPVPPASPLPEYAEDASPEMKLEIEYLLDIALKHGISKALDESAKSPFFVQDAFHDALAGRLYPELQKRGIVK